MSEQFQTRQPVVRAIGAVVAVVVTMVLFFYAGGESPSTAKHQLQDANAPTVTPTLG